MIIRYATQRWCCNVDWLQWSVQLKSKDFNFKELRGIRVDVLPGTNVFKDRAIIYNADGEKIMTLCYHPYSRILSPLLMTVQVANQFLYGYQFDKCQSLLEQMVDCSFCSMGRIDLCVDFELDDDRRDIIAGLFDGRYYVERKKEGSIFWHQDVVGNQLVRFPHALSWGAAQSDIRFKVYNKSREQGLPAGKPDKPYIVDEWRDAGMQTNNVWRWEVSMMASGGLLWNGQLLTLPVLMQHLTPIYMCMDMYHRRWVVRDKMQRSHAGSGQRLDLLRLPKGEVRADWIVRGNYQHVNEIKRLCNSLLKVLDSPAMLVNEDAFNNTFATLAGVVDKYYLHGWFQTTHDGLTMEEYYNERLGDIGYGTHKRTPALGEDI